MSALGRVGAITAKEFKQLARDRVTFGMIVMIPLMQLILFGYAISTMVRHIPVALVDNSGSGAARVISEQVRVTQVVDIVSHYPTAAEAEAAIIAGTVRAALILPENLTQRAAGGEPVGQWLVDGRRPSRFRAAVSAAAMEQQSTALLQLVPARGQRAGTRRAAVDQTDGRKNGRRSCHRSPPSLRYRDFVRWGDDSGDAGQLSGRFRWWSCHRRRAISHRQGIAGGSGEHLSGALPFG